MADTSPAQDRTTAFVDAVVKLSQASGLLPEEMAGLLLALAVNLEEENSGTRHAAEWLNSVSTAYARRAKLEPARKLPGIEGQEDGSDWLPSFSAARAALGENRRLGVRSI